MNRERMNRERMNRERAKELVGKQHIIEAIAEGKVIQHNVPTLSKKSRWMDIDNPLLSEDAENYRVKPEPRVFWLTEHQDGSISFHQESECVSKGSIRVIEDLSDD